MGKTPATVHQKKQAHRFDIELDSVGATGAVKMDGKILKGVTGIVLEATVHGLTRLSLDFLPKDILIRYNGEDVVVNIQAFEQLPEGFIPESKDVTAMGDRFKVYADQSKPEPLVERISGSGEEALQDAIEKVTA